MGALTKNLDATSWTMNAAQGLPIPHAPSRGPVTFIIGLGIFH